MNLSLAISFLLLNSVFAAKPADDDDDGRYIIRYKNNAGMDKVRANSRSVHHDLGRQNAVAVTMNGSAAQRLGRDPDIDYIELDQKRYPTSKVGSSLRGHVRDARRLAQSTPYGIGMVEADQVTYAGGMKICIIDSGYDFGHVDLPTTNVTGYDGQSNLPWDSDGNGHGTHVAGTIAAVDNAEGVIGTTPGVSLHIVRVFGDTGRWAYSSTLADAANRCVAAGSNIISMSLGGGGPSTTEENALSVDGVLSIAAAGNDGNTACSYPASYPSVVSVAAVDAMGNRASFSQMNSQVELAAPGVGVMSTVSGPATSYAVSSLSISTVDFINPFPFEKDGSVPFLPLVDLPLVDCGLAIDSVNVGDCVGDLSSTYPGGFICLVQRGDITFAEKAAYCGSVGGQGIVIYNNVPGPISGVTIGDNYGGIPAIGISDTEGQSIKLISPLPSGQFQVTVNVGADKQSYSEYSGTSMATPHVSGVAALVWSNHQDCTAQEIRNALICNTDSNLPRDNELGYGIIKAKKASDALTAAGSCDGCGGSPPAPLGTCGGGGGGGECAVEGQQCRKKNCENWIGCNGAGSGCCCCDGSSCEGNGRLGTCQ